MNTRTLSIKKSALPLLAALALAIPLRGARADEFAPDRFKGGTSDGFSSVGIYRDNSVIAALVRFQEEAETDMSFSRCPDYGCLRGNVDLRSLSPIA
jgi:hypothetical protein